MSVVKIYIKQFKCYRKSWWPNGERVVLWLEGLGFKTRLGDYVVFFVFFFGLSLNPQYGYWRTVWEAREKAGGGV